MQQRAYDFPIISSNLKFETRDSRTIMAVRENFLGTEILIGITIYNNKLSYTEDLLTQDEWNYCNNSRINLLRIKEILIMKFDKIDKFKICILDLLKREQFKWILHVELENELSIHYIGLDDEVHYSLLNSTTNSIHINRYSDTVGDFSKYMERCGIYVTYEQKIQLYLKACDAYDNGEDIMSNSEFDILEKELRNLGYDGVNLRHEDVTYTNNTETDIDDTGYSIQPLGSWDEVLEFIRNAGDNALIFTPKFDGVNCKNQTGSNFSAQSRSNDNPIDYTDAMYELLPEIAERHLIVGEVFLEEKYLQEFRDKYDTNKYKLPRSAALSILRLPLEHDEEDVQKLSFIAYNTDKSFQLKSDMFAWFDTLGIERPKYICKCFNTVEDIKSEVQTIMNELDDGLPMDGIVMEFNNLKIVPSVNAKYLSTQAAIKVDKWGVTYHTAIVNGLNLTQKKGSFGAVLTIEPTLVEGVTVRKVNAFNYGIVLSENIEKGSEIKFVRKSNGMSFLKYGSD